MAIILAGIYKGISSRLQSNKARCPFPCKGTLEKIIPERGQELSTPHGFKQQYQFHCKLCGADIFGTSGKAASKTKLNHVQLKAWRTNHAHGKWVQEGWRGRKVVFAGFW